ncbi:MAG: T9SS type A sorting domain-containing protein [bacterium]
MPVGNNVVTLTVSDGLGGLNSDQVTINVVDDGSVIPLPFYETFSDGNLDGWGYDGFSTGLYGPAVTPTLSNGRAELITHDQQNNVIACGSPTWNNYVIEADMRVEQSLEDGYNGLRVAFYLSSVKRAPGNNIMLNTYYLDFQGRNGSWYLRHYYNDGNSGSNLATGNRTIAVGIDYHIKISIRGNRILAYFNEVGGVETLLVDLTVIANALTGGGVGFLGADDRISFDNVSIASLPPINHPPIADAGLDQTIECISTTSTPVQLNASASSDPDGDELTFTWTGPFGTVTGPTPIVTLPCGSHLITLTVNDGHGGTSTDQVVINIVDAKPPIITVASPAYLSPPNHKYISFNLSAMVRSVNDACAGEIPVSDVQIVSASSDELEDAPGDDDGNTYNDIVIAQDCRSIQVRAERMGGGNGRVYTVNLAVIDPCGNKGTASYRINVLPNQSKGAVALDDGPIYIVQANPQFLIASQGATSDLVLEKMREELSNVPSEFKLSNYPNPFNPSTTIEYNLPSSEYVTLRIFNLIGEQVGMLVNEQKGPGRHSVRFDTRNLPSGIYIYRMQAGKYIDTKRMLLLK